MTNVNATGVRGKIAGRTFAGEVISKSAMARLRRVLSAVAALLGLYLIGFPCPALQAGSGGVTVGVTVEVIVDVPDEQTPLSGSVFREGFCDTCYIAPFLLSAALSVPAGAFVVKRRRLKREERELEEALSELYGALGE